MKLINIGFGNLVSAERVLAIVSPDSAPIKRLIQESRERGMLIDATYGRKTASVFVMDSDHVVLSAIAAEKLAQRLGLEILGGLKKTNENREDLYHLRPSGVGKSTVLRELLRDRDDLYFSISATTRTPREGEINGVHYHFINVDRFREMIQEDEFLEYAEYVGNFYGTPKRYVDEAMAQGKDVILDIEVQGALQVIGKRPGYRAHLHRPPSWDALEQRLTGRGTDSPEKIQKRLVRAKVELQTADTYDYFVINDTVENAVREINAIMLAEHCRPSERMEILQ